MMFHCASDIHFPEDFLGIIPDMIRDNRPLREQLDEGYAHGGGWKPLPNFTLAPNGGLSYCDDEPRLPRVWTVINDEQLIFYPNALVAIVQRDGTFEVARMN